MATKFNFGDLILVFGFIVILIIGIGLVDVIIAWIGKWIDKLF